MTSSLYEKILELQATDIKILQLNHQHTNHKLRTQLANTTSDAETKKAEAAAAVSALEQNDSAQRKLQHRVAELEAKQEASKTKLYSGMVTAANELLALEEEVQGYQAKQDDLEDELLELMDQADNLRVIERATRTQLNAAESDVASTEAQLAEALEGISTELKHCATERDERVSASDPKLLDQYEKLRPLYDGVTVATLANGSCDGCHIQLSAVALDRIDRLEDSAIFTCEECGRMLVR